MKLYKKMFIASQTKDQYQDKLTAKVGDISIELRIEEYPIRTPVICLGKTYANIYIPIKDWEAIKNKIGNLLAKEDNELSYM